MSSALCGCKFTGVGCRRDLDSNHLLSWGGEGGLGSSYYRRERRDQILTRIEKETNGVEIARLKEGKELGKAEQTNPRLVQLELRSRHYMSDPRRNSDHDI